jgi:hypothetical protein
VDEECGHAYTNDAGTDVPAPQMNDYIDIGIFGATGRDSAGRSQSNPLYSKKYKLTAGEHAFDVIVNGKPIRKAISSCAFELSVLVINELNSMLCSLK